MKMKEITKDTQLYEACRNYDYFSGKVEWTIKPVKVAKINNSSVYVTDSKYSHRYKISGRLPAMLDSKHVSWDHSIWLTDNPNFADWQNGLIERQEESDKEMRDLWDRLNVNEKEKVVAFIKKTFESVN